MYLIKNVFAGKPAVYKALLLALMILPATLSAKAAGMLTDSAGRHKAAPADAVPASPTDISPLLIGEGIPAVNLPDASGKNINLNEAIAKKPTILIFYRGGWCPFCNRQLAGVQTIEADLRKMGYQIIAVSTDSPENLSKTLDKHKLTYTLLSDSELSVSRQFGIAYVGPKSYERTLLAGSGGKNVDKLLPVPSVFILDTKGIIKFEYINPDFKQRISPDLLQAVAAALVKEAAIKN